MSKCAQKEIKHDCLSLWCSSKNKKVAAKEMLLTLCVIHREHLAETKPPANLKNVLDNVVKTVNEVRSRVLNSRLQNCEKIWSRSLNIFSIRK